MTQGETIILRMLELRELYGYELEKIIEHNKIRRWSDIGFSSIYHILNKLEKKGFVSSRKEKQPGAPARKVYSLLDDGRSALISETKRMIGAPGDCREDVTVGLMLSGVLSNKEFVECLAAYKEKLAMKKNQYLTEVPDDARRREPVRMATHRAIALIDAELKWLDDLS